MRDRQPVDVAAASIMVAICAVWGTQQVAIKLAAPDMAPLLQVGLRSGIAALVVLLAIALRREFGALVGASWRPGVVAGLTFGLEFVLFAQGLLFTSATRMAIFLYTGPVFIALILHVRLAQERLAPVQWIGIAIAFTGIVLAFSGRGGAAPGDMTWIGDLLGIVAGALWGATTLVLRTTRLAEAPPAVTLWYQLMGAFVLATGGALAMGETQATPTPTLLASLAFQSLVVSTASYLVWFSLIRRYLASRLGVLTLMTPIFGVGAGVVVLGDSLSLPFVAGAMLILLGILVVSGQDALLRRTVRSAVAAAPG